MAPNGNSSNVYIVFASAALDSVHATLEAGNTRCNNAIGEGLWAVHLKVKPLLGGTVTVDAPENLVNHTQVLADAAIDYNGESSSSSKGKFEDGGSTDKVKKFLNGQGNSLRGQTFAVTGTFDTYGRKDIVQMLKNYGGDVLQELRVNMNLVVTGTHLGPKKERQINKWGLKTVNEGDFIDFLEEACNSKRVAEADNEDDDTEEGDIKGKGKAVKKQKK